MSPSSPERVVLALGANLGAPRRQLLDAIAELSRHLGPLSVVPLYRSAPVSPLPQPDFLNTALLARTARPPAELLALVKALERAAGRRPGPRWGPRPLDVDLIAVGDRVLENSELTLPHPRVRERAFVLAPLADLAPELRLPPDGATVAALLAALPVEPGLVRVGWNEPG